MIIVLIVFLILSLVLIYGNLKNSFETDLNNTTTKISVIVAAKNEEKNIPKIISSLTNQNYLKENYEVIIVDDNSEDNTFEIAKKCIKGLSNFTVLKVAEKKYIGKRGALQFGIEQAKHPNILITDADCKPMQNWIKEFASRFNAGFDFIFGIAPYEQDNSFVNKIASFDNLRTHILTFGFAKLGLPYSAAARSFGFKKTSFIAIEGYKNTTDTLSGDDDLLLRQAVKNNLEITTVTEPDAFVFSETEKTFSEYLNQKARHTSTSNYYSLKMKIVLGVWHLLNLLFLISPLLMFIDVHFGTFFITKLLVDFITVKLLMKKFGYKFNVLEIVYFQIIYEVLLVINYLNGIFKKQEW